MAGKKLNRNTRNFRVADGTALHPARCCQHGATSAWRDWVERVVAKPVVVEDDEFDGELEHRLGKVPEIANHEVLEAMTVGVLSPPAEVCDLNEAGFEQAAKDAHRRHGLANAASVLQFLREFGFTN